MSDEPRTNTSDLAQAETPRGDHDAPADTNSRRDDREAQADDAHDKHEEPPKQRSKFFDPDVRMIDRDNFINRLYDAPDEEWGRWRTSADGRTRYRI